VPVRAASPVAAKQDRWQKVRHAIGAGAALVVSAAAMAACGWGLMRLGMRLYKGRHVDTCDRDTQMDERLPSSDSDLPQPSILHMQSQLQRAESPLILDADDNPAGEDFEIQGDDPGEEVEIDCRDV